MSNTFWFVVPVYFDVESFSILRSRLLEVLGDSRLHSDWPAHFVVVDDSAGRDAEIARLAELSDTSVLTPRFNLGHQLALVYGLRKMSASMRDDDIVVTLDADGEDRPEDLPNLLAPVLEGGADDMAIALARRTHRQESPLFKLWYFFFRILFRALTGTSVRTGNYVAYHGCVARRTLFHPSFDLCYSSTFLSLDLTRRFVSCPRGLPVRGKLGNEHWSARDARSANAHALP